MRVFDCFMYFNEDVVLELRLNYLDKFVDQFIIIESTFNHRGQKKNLNFDIDKFPEFKNKIKYFVLDTQPSNLEKIKDSDSEDEKSKKYIQNGYKRDHFQRNYILKGIMDAEPNDMIVISDIDEIPNPDTINNFNKEKKYACFIQKNFQSKLNLLNLSEPNWYGTRICVKKFLKSPQWLRNIKIKKKSFWKFYRTPMPQLIENGGWHFSFLKDSSQISSKLKSYAHQEYNNDKINKVELIEEKLKKGEDILGRNFYYKPVKIDSSFPRHILENINKLDKWIV